MMKRRDIVYAGIWLLLALAPTIAWGAAPEPAAHETATMLRAGDGNVQVTGGLFYHFETEPLTHLQAARLDDSDWTRAAHPTPNLGISSDPVWLRFDLHNVDNDSGHWFMELSWTVLDRIEVYLLHHDSGRWEGPMISGNLVPRAQRIIEHAFYIFPVYLQPGGSATVYVRARSDNRLVFPIVMMQKQALRDMIRTRSILAGLTFGILAVMAVYNLLLFFTTRDWSFLYFSFFVSSLILYLLTTTGLGAFYLWDKVVWFKAHGFGAFASLCFLSAALFIRSFLRLEKYGGWVLRLSSMVIAVWLLLTGLHLIASFPALPMVTDLAAVVSTLAGIVTALYCWMVKKDPSARIFTFTWSLMAVSTFFLSLSLLGVVGSIFLAMYVQVAGFVIVVIGLSFALPERINRERQARSEAKTRALTLSETIAEERAAKIAVQQQALSLEMRIQEDLETRVAARSEELEKAMARLQSANQTLERLNIVDALTNVYNRGYFDRALAERTLQSQDAGEPMAVVLADIDHFKAINDTHGHLIGDACLGLVAKTIREQVDPQNALAARYGGEEFAVIMTATEAEQACRAAEKIRMAVENIDFSNRGQRIGLRLSLGVAAWKPAPGASPEQMVHSADQALYRAKQLGRNRVEMAPPQ